MVVGNDHYKLYQKFCRWWVRKHTGAPLPSNVANGHLGTGTSISSAVLATRRQPGPDPCAGGISEAGAGSSDQPRSVGAETAALVTPEVEAADIDQPGGGPGAPMNAAAVAPNYQPVVVDGVAVPLPEEAAAASANVQLEDVIASRRMPAAVVANNNQSNSCGSGAIAVAISATVVGSMDQQVGGGANVGPIGVGIPEVASSASDTQDAGAGATPMLSAAEVASANVHLQAVVTDAMPTPAASPNIFQGEPGNSARSSAAFLLPPAMASPSEDAESLQTQGHVSHLIADNERLIGYGSAEGQASSEIHLLQANPTASQHEAPNISRYLVGHRFSKVPGRPFAHPHGRNQKNCTGVGATASFPRQQHESVSAGAGGAPSSTAHVYSSVPPRPSAQAPPTKTFAPAPSGRSKHARPARNGYEPVSPSHPSLTDTHEQARVKLSKQYVEAMQGDSGCEHEPIELMQMVPGTPAALFNPRSISIPEAESRPSATEASTHADAGLTMPFAITQAGADSPSNPSASEN